MLDIILVAAVFIAAIALVAAFLNICTAADLRSLPSFPVRRRTPMSQELITDSIPKHHYYNRYVISYEPELKMSKKDSAIHLLDGQSARQHDVDHETDWQDEV